MSAVQSGSDEVEEWNRGEAMAAPMFAQLEEVLQSNGNGAQRFERIKSVILPQLPALIAAQKPSALIAQEFMERTSIGLTMFATRVYKAEQDSVTAIAALKIARKLVTNERGAQLIEGNLAVLTPLSKKEACLYCGENAHSQSVDEVSMYRNKTGGGGDSNSFETVTVPIPRCEPCKNKEDSSRIALVVVPLVALVVGVFSGNTHGSGGFFLGGICGGVVAFGTFLLILYVMARYNEFPAGYPPVKERLDGGWLIGSPPEPEEQEAGLR
jgi:hypothetical protein